MPNVALSISAVEGSELAELSSQLDQVPAQPVKTFTGNKTSLSGKFAAARGLMGLPTLASNFERFLLQQRCDVAICSMLSIWDIAALRALRHTGTRFILVLHDAKLHPGDSYPFREMLMRREVAAADALIVLTEHVRRDAERIYGFPRDRNLHGTPRRLCVRIRRAACASLSSRAASAASLLRADCRVQGSRTPPRRLSAVESHECASRTRHRRFRRHDAV